VPVPVGLDQEVARVRAGDGERAPLQAAAPEFVIVSVTALLSLPTLTAPNVR
jgi:hypothetical protein